MAASAGARDGRSPLSIELSTVDGAPLDELRFTNAGSDTFRWTPDRFRVTVRGGDPDDMAGSRLHLVPPANWRVLPGGSREWLVFPAGIPSFPVVLRVVRPEAGQQTVVAESPVPVVFCGRNRFDPGRDRLPWANRLDDLGTVDPDSRHFRATFRFALAPRLFFRGLYSEVVGLRRLPDGRVSGGLCTGLSRVALARALGQLEEPEGLRDLVLVLHGRQLSDRALLAGLPWFLFPSPRRAYRAFVNDLLERGWSERCFDINVPRPWRRDVIRALLGQGHTVVPYAFCQRDADQAQVWVYDPNIPDQADASIVTFDLRRDRYRYPPLAVDERRTTVVAVPLEAYLRGRTAILASLGNLFLLAYEHARKSRRARRVAAMVFLASCGAMLWKYIGGRQRAGRLSETQRARRLTSASRSAAASAASASRRSYAPPACHSCRGSRSGCC
ncbi:hypothetical protein OO015_07285 [Thermomicrobium sp. 4228-Ro]|uniref:hypothetical protein n=1 Tax=Thermomicrobium sp. 4228-Ro TaxID=2993937 RepID=UPI00224960B9|nr:hypothetical protein [Thermomicrobium sp. 4228-Ro]MCX2727300.1 hypothetical protein [Thermomicrobium sp. 4228-Ro]